MKVHPIVRAHYQTRMPLWRLLQVLWVFCCCSWLVACGGNVSNNKFSEGLGTIQGQVFFPDGSVASKAEVYVVNLPALTAVTDDQGRFTLPDVPVGRREIVLTHERPYAVRVSIWVVRDYTVTLDKSSSVLESAGSIKGLINASPRFDNKGITVRIKGLPFEVLSSDESGHFTLKKLPVGCHVLQVSAPFFGTVERADVCVRAGKATELDEVIALAPSTPCLSEDGGGHSCGEGAICVKNACVPDPGGRGELKQSGVLDFGALLFEQEVTQEPALLTNVGPGRLTIRSIKLTSPTRTFSIRLPPLPLVLEKGQTFSPTITFNGRELGTHQAILEIETDTFGQPTLSARVKGTVTLYSKDCVTLLPKEISLRKLALDQSTLFELLVTNRCSRSLLLSSAGTQSNPDKGRCDATAFGTFSMAQCTTLVQELPLKIEPGRTVRLQFQVIPKEYGMLEGTLKLRTDEAGAGELKIPVNGYVPLPESTLTISPRSLSFGQVPAGEARTLWVQLSFAKAPSQELIDKLQWEVDASHSQWFEVKRDALVRRSVEGSVLFVPVLFKGRPQAGSMNAILTIRGLPGREGTATIVPLSVEVQQKATLALRHTLVVGRTNGCAGVPQPLYIDNPTSSPLFVQGVSWAMHTRADLQLSPGAFPLVVSAKSRSLIGSVQLTPRDQHLQTYGQLEVSIEHEQQALRYMIAVEGSAGKRVEVSFAQAKGKQARLVLAADKSMGALSALTQLKSTLSSLLQTLRRKGVDVQVDVIKPVGVVSLAQLTSRPEDELVRLLQANQLSSNQVLSRAQEVLSQQNQTARPAALLLFSKQDDQSPLPLEHHFVGVNQQPSAIFAAVPRTACAGPTPRYEQATRQSAGALLDICSTSAQRWDEWRNQIEQFLVGQRKQFPLTQAPNPSTLSLSNGTKTLLSTQWSYNPEDNKIQLAYRELLNAGETLSLSFYTACVGP